MEDIKFAKKKQEDEDAGIEYYRSISTYDIQKGSTKRTLCGIVLFKLNTFLVMFLQVPSIDSTCFPHP
jgi:hypothetical protein